MTTVLGLLPRALLRLAAAQLRPSLRQVVYQNEWVPELEFILCDEESGPVIRLIGGLRFAGGMLFAGWRVSRISTREAVEQPAPPSVVVRLTTPNVAVTPAVMEGLIGAIGVELRQAVFVEGRGADPGRWNAWLPAPRQWGGAPD